MPIYFYKVSDPYGSFSNFSPHPIRLNGQDWQTVEHYYQAHKFFRTTSEHLMQAIRNAATPEAAAKLGRTHDRTCGRSDWDAAKIVVMREAVLVKFLTHRDAQNLLLATGNELIVEDSPTDYF
jgi:N-glycosidase YbiA